MVAVHAALYTTMLLLTLGLSAWAMFFLVTGRAVDGAFRSTYVLMIGVAALQALSGVVLLFQDRRPGESFHYLYGVSLLVFTGAGYAFATRGDQRREAVTLALASIFAFGLITRAAATAY